MKSMTLSNIAWMLAITIIAITINPFLKVIGILPADVFRSYGVFYPGLPQLVFGPLMAFLLLLCFLKTGEPLVFPIIGIARALSLSFIFPANLVHSGTGLSAIIAGVIAVVLLKNAHCVRSRIWLPALAGLYAGFYAAGNYVTTFVFGPAAQNEVIIRFPHLAIGVVVGSLAMGTILGLLACRLMRPLQASTIVPLAPRFGF